MKKKAVLAILLALAAAGCGTQQPSGDAGNGNVQGSAVQNNGEQQQQQQQQQQQTKGEAEGTSKEEPKQEEAKEKVFKVGDSFELKDWKVTVDSFEFNQSVKDDMFSSSAEEGNKFLILRLSLTNNGTEAGRFIEMIGGADVKAIYNEKYEYRATLTMIDGDLSSVSVPPLSDAKGFIVIKMPDKVVEATEGVKVNFSLEGESASVVIR